MLSKNTIISAVSNLSTAYNLTIVSLAFTISTFVYPEDKASTTASTSAVKTAALIGAIAGQLTMGYVGDWLGRSRAMGITMGLTIVGALLSSIQKPYGVDTPGPDITGMQMENYYAVNGTWKEHSDDLGLTSMHSEYVWLTFTRFILGVGVGGVYPLAATIAAESSTNNKTRGRQVSLVFSTQGIGFLLCPIVVMILATLNPSTDIKLGTEDGNVTSPAHGCLKYYTVEHEAAHNNSLLGPGFGPADEQSKVYGTCSDGANDMNWRFALALGALPGLFLLPYKVAETSNVVRDPTRKSTFWSDLGRREYWPKLLGTAGGWFFFDIVFYGNSLFAPVVTSHVFGKHDMDLMTVCAHNAIVFAIALPGYWVATYYMDILGRKNIQLLGFGMMTILFSLLAALLGPLKFENPAVLLIVYGLTFFFANFGPNSTTFILPSETFPPEVRASLNGFSAACGKAGAAIGAALFKPLSSSLGVPAVLLICGIISLIGVAVTFLFVKDYRGKNMAGSESRMGYQSINADESRQKLMSNPVDHKTYNGV